MLDKTFSPSSFETQIYKKTEAYFKAGKNLDKNPFCLMMPPPNVTGNLHVGHALTYTLQDIIVRFKRMQGYDTLWQPGTDHAGIATQSVVERQITAEGLTRHTLGREKFIERVWQWKEKSGNAIVEQQRRLGISADWDRSRFTMDEGLSKAVIKVFVSLYNQGLIYRAKRLVNWDCKLGTAISDLEVINQEAKSGFWYIRYPLALNSNEEVIIATTRPETMFGDTAVAVHPEDERYQHLIGQMIDHPLTGRQIPIIADSYCDPEKGTGAVKITPAHDFNDFAIGGRHNLPILNILDANGLLNDEVPEEFKGLSIEAARKKTLAALTDQGFLVKEETINNTTPISERTGVEVQPWLTDQWFVDAYTLAQPAIKAVEEGRTKFIPDQSGTYFEWLRNIQPWCISRQIWWGHQIPAWFGPDDHIFVAESEIEALAQAKNHYGKETKLRRETDVLDTWFSSALWPFSTLGWPDQTPDLKRYYPTDVLVTGFDIIFFWVARMMMMGLHFMGDVPFKTVYVHALVRDEKGQKMSKSKGNVIDPLLLMDKYGTDAVRFTLAALAAPGRDVKMGESRVEGYRNFITKIWNAARFLQMNECAFDESFNGFEAKTPINQWIVHKLAELEKTIHAELEIFRFDLAAHTLYQFLWGTYCDVYVECLKPLLAPGNEAVAFETKKMAPWVLVEFLKLAHPFMPLITETLWEEFYPDAFTPLIETSWPKYPKNTFKEEVADVELAIQLVEELRSLRGLLGIQPGLKLSVRFMGDEKYWMLLNEHWNWISHLARLDALKKNTGLEKALGDVPLNFGEQVIFLELGEQINLNDAQQLLLSKKNTLSKEVDHLEKKLENLAYKDAKPDQWQQDKNLYDQKNKEKSKLETILSGW